MLQINFDPFPILHTERLLLRRLVKTDVAAIFKLRSDAKSMQYIPRPLLKDTDEALEHIAMIEDKIVNNIGINWAVTLKEKPAELIGLMGHFRIDLENYRSEIGYMTLPEFTGQGITTEALICMVKYGFEALKLHSTEALIDPENVASARVLEKIGFVKEAHFRENEYYDGKFIDTVVYSILNK